MGKKRKERDVKHLVKKVKQQLMKTKSKQESMINP